MKRFFQTSSANRRLKLRRPVAEGASDEGYALVALLAAMTIMVMLAMAAAPNIQKQVQREREIEAIIRGEEVADAIERYARMMNGQLPTSMDQLLEGANAPGRTKKVRVLRAYAVRDPLSTDGEWRLIQSNGRENSRFGQALITYMEGRPLSPSNEQWKQQHRRQQLGGDFGREETDGGEDTSSNSNVPFIGVLSRSRRDSIILYFGIDRHDEWLFTPVYR